jgi:hypothetical protein
VSGECVSVIIPSYNYAHFLPAAIDSALRQSYRNIEVIVIDDGSVDDTAVVAARYGNRIQYIRQENQGLSAARNRGLQTARGTLIQFLDADDVLGQTSVQERVAYLECHPETSAVICRTCYFQHCAKPQVLAPLFGGWRQPPPGLVDLALHFRNIAPPHAFLVRKSVIDRHALRFDTGVRACEDYDFWFRLALRSGPPAVLRTGWVQYRQHPGSMSKQLANQHRHDAELCRRVFQWIHHGGERMGPRADPDYYAAMLASALVTAERIADQDRPFCLEFLSGHVRDVAKALCALNMARPVSTAAELYLALGRIALHRLEHKHQILEATAVRTINDAISPGPGFRGRCLLDSTAPLFVRLRLLKLDFQWSLLRARQQFVEPQL